MSQRTSTASLRIALLATLALSAAACADEAATLPQARMEHGIEILDEELDPSSSAGRYIVVLHQGEESSGAVAEELVGGAGGQIVHVYGNALPGFAADLPAGAAAQLQGDPRVAYVEMDQPVTGGQVSQSPAPWALDRVDQRGIPLNGTYTYAQTGQGVVVYVIDSGIQTAHAEFGGRASIGFDAFGGTGQDCQGHGTHVAGIAGGSIHGVAKGATLVGVRVLDCAGNGTVAGVIAGVDWVRANRAALSVANMSLEGPASQALDAAVAGLVASGVTVVAAAGNQSANACSFSPARAAAAITVGATTSGDQFATYSNRGACVDLNAPGTSVMSAWIFGDSAASTGTSMAAPHVAGAAALFLQANPSATPAGVTTALLGSATSGQLGGLPAGTPNLLVHTVFDGSSRVPLHRMYSPNSGDHLYGLWPNEGTQWGYYMESRSYFHLRGSPATGFAALYRCYLPRQGSTGDHFLSTDAACEGRTNEGLLGYIATSQLTGTVPLYRLYSAQYGETMYSVSTVEVQVATTSYGYVNMGVTGFVYLQP